MIILLDGKPVEPDAASLPVGDRGFLLGDGLFSTLRIARGIPMLLSRHLDRLEEGGKVLRMPIDCAALERDAREAAGFIEGPEGAMRITLSRGTGPRGLLPPEEPQVRRIVTAASTAPRSSAPVQVILSTHRRNEHSPLSRMKSLSYMDQVLARMEAAEAGAADAIMLNTRGEPASTTMANLLVLTDAGWITPPLETGILPGITRAVLIEQGAVREVPVTEDQLKALPLARSNALVGVEPLALEGGAAPDIESVRRLTEALEAAEKAGL